MYIKKYALPHYKVYNNKIKYLLFSAGYTHLMSSDRSWSRIP